jgi:iron complex outermembrane receptor protein
VGAAVLAINMPAHAQDAGAIVALKTLSVEDLMNIEVTSVSKTAEPVSEAAAAIYVITHDDIQRAGASSLPEMLRMAPNLQVARISATSYAISARGFNLFGSDKLLVLIDGRSIYTPYFSGVFWDEQGVLPEDIERIEVISGPGATLWGANAVNGVINIITRRSSATQGGVVDAGGGNLERRSSAQYGGAVSDMLTYRFYGNAFQQSDDVTKTGANALDGWHKVQEGFRADWAPAGNVVTLQGDAYEGSERQAALENQDLAGRNLLARWTRAMDGGSSLQVQSYYDHTSRTVAGGGGGDALTIYDFDVQHSFSWAGRQQIVWGGGVRREQDEFGNVLTTIPATFFSPYARTLVRENFFGQDTVSLSRTLNLILGMKLEKDAYVSVAPLPNVRLSWKVTDTELLWAAVSRAVRAPSREDRDLDEAVIIPPKPIYLLVGGDFQSEKLTAYEVGYRAQPAPRLSFSISTFYNVYDDLRSVQETPVTVIPLTFANGMEGNTFGLESWGNFQAADWWRLSAGFNWLHENLRFKPGASTVAGIASAGDDPNHQFSLRSSMSFVHGLTLDADLRWIGSLPNPAVPAYVELNSRVGWSISRSLDVSLTGSNLLHAHHVEYVVAPATVEIARSYVIGARWRF